MFCHDVYVECVSAALCKNCSILSDPLDVPSIERSREVTYVHFALLLIDICPKIRFKHTGHSCVKPAIRQVCSVSRRLPWYTMHWSQHRGVPTPIARLSRDGSLLSNVIMDLPRLLIQLHTVRSGQRSCTLEAERRLGKIVLAGSDSRATHWGWITCASIVSASLLDGRPTPLLRVLQHSCVECW